MNLGLFVIASGHVDARYKDESKEKEALLRHTEILVQFCTMSPSGWICVFSLEVRIGQEGGMATTDGRVSVFQVMTAESETRTPGNTPMAEESPVCVHQGGDPRQGKWLGKAYWERGGF